MNNFRRAFLDRGERTFFALAIAALVFLARPANASLISVGTFPATPTPDITIPAGTFLVPIDVQGAAGLSSWQFDLMFNPAVVQEVDPLDGSSGIYGAAFNPSDLSTTSFILAGFPFNPLGVVSGVAGSYPGLLDGVTGNGVLAYILFDFLPGQETDDPGFAIDNPMLVEAVPEPPSLALLALGILLIATRRKKLRQSI